jgi:signal transduction histidine kinase
MTTIRDPARLAALAETGLLDAPRQEAFQRLAHLARRILHVDLSLVTAITEDRQITLAATDESVTRERDLDRSFCRYVVATGTRLVVPDTRRDPLLRDHPGIAEGVIAYAGIPLRAPGGYVLGSFCAVASSPREWTEEEIGILEDLAESAATEVELRVDNEIRRRMEQKLADAYRQAEAANMAKSDFLASMSHELRTPLNSVIGFTNMLLKNRDGRLQETELKYLDRVRANGMHLLALINEVLDLAKVEAGRLELHLAQVDLAMLLETTAEELQGRAQEGVVLEVASPPQLRPIIADPLRLKQVLINLTGNALKFTEAGRVTVRVRADADGTPHAIEVEDTGIGIPQDRLTAVFEPFTQADARTHAKFGGTGLGLAISSALCQMMGFELSVESREGVGSVFRIGLGGMAG